MRDRRVLLPLTPCIDRQHDELVGRDTEQIDVFEMTASRCPVDVGGCVAKRKNSSTYHIPRLGLPLPIDLGPLVNELRCEAKESLAVAMGTNGDPAKVLERIRAA